MSRSSWYWQACCCCIHHLRRGRRCKYGVLLAGLSLAVFITFPYYIQQQKSHLQTRAESAVKPWIGTYHHVSQRATDAITSKETSSMLSTSTVVVDSRSPVNSIKIVPSGRPASTTSPTSISKDSTSRVTSPAHTALLRREPVLDRVGIKMIPRSAIVPEGHPFQVTCASVKMLLNQAKSAPYMTFELPPMSTIHERQVHMTLRSGAAVLTFYSISKGHEGTYKCIATDKSGKKTFNTITVSVIPRDVDYDSVEEEQQRAERLKVLGAGDMFAPEDVEINRAMHQHKRQRGGVSPEVDESKLDELRERLHNDDVKYVDMDQLLSRGKFQEQQVDKFCHKYGLSNLTHKLPSENDSTNSYYRHLIINDKQQTLFCFVPKVGCTNLRILFFLVQGYIPLSQFLQSRDKVDQNKLESAQFLESFFSRNDHQRRFSLEHYFKYIMYRNPLDRLISGFRSKVVRYPLLGLDKNKPHFNWLRKSIFLQTHPEKYQEYLHQRGKIPINITFSDFIDYWLQQPQDIKFDEHFRSILSICQPCRTRYNFYGNFKNFEVDSRVLVERIKAKPQYIRQGYYQSSQVSTEQLAPTLYAQLSTTQKVKVLKLLAQELDFYYHIFPEERNSHKSILGLGVELPESP